MCGIAGYAGMYEAKSFLVDGLKKLEYRGYDSSGIATIEAGEIKVTKAKGKLDKLINKTETLSHKGCVGIGHTRWATHGKPDENNSHPHMSNDKRFAIVHNGIIENYIQLKEMLVQNGFKFQSDTDTEVIPNLIQYFYRDDVFEAFSNAVSMLKGSYALGMLSAYEPDKFFAVSKDSPLIAGVGENENYIASDIYALLSKTRKVYLMKENEFAVVSKDVISVMDRNKKPIYKDFYEVGYSEIATDKQGYEFFMLTEIMEQPTVIENTISERIKGGLVDLSEITLTDNYFSKLNRIYIVGCGSAYHAGLAGKKIIEDLARVSTVTELASEFRYNNPVISKGDLVIVISQSGETSDTLSALRLAKEKGAEIISIVNVRESSIARESSNVIYTNAGPEIAVATTKGYLSQIIVLYLLAVHISSARKLMAVDKHRQFTEQITKLSGFVEEILKGKEKVNELSKEFLLSDNVFFIGRGLDYCLAMEGALKLKEISYINAQCYAAGELKHGTISLVEEGTVVFALCTEKTLLDKMIGNIKEVKARGATVIVIKTNDMKEPDFIADKVINVADINKYFSGLLAIIYLQLLAYYVSYNKGLDVDKPKNLAKSVTVE